MIFDYPFSTDGLKFSDDFNERFDRLDVPKLARDFGITAPQAISEFSDRLKAILDRFLQDKRPSGVPKRSVVLSQFRALQKPARKLLDELQTLEGDGNYVVWALQTGYEANYPLDDDQIDCGDEYAGLSSFERDLDRLKFLLERILSVSDDMLEETAPGGAKGQMDHATHNSVRCLASLYHEQTGVPPKRGHSKVDGVYVGPFFAFVDECLSTFAPDHYRGNSSLGNIIERALKKYPH